MPAHTTHRGIVVGVDGSPASRVAVDWAAKEASLRRVPLTLVHVIASNLLPTWVEIPMRAEFEAELNTGGRRLLCDALQTAREATKRLSLIDVQTEIVTAPVLPTLIEFSKGPAMIVVGCRGVGGIRRRLLGSVSWGLVLHARCPVAVIHDEDPLMPTPAKAPVVVGIDGSPASEAATALAFDEASRRGVELVAVHAWSDHSAFELPGVEWTDVQVQAEEALAARLAGWQERYPDVTVRRVVVLDRPTRALLAESEAAQLTVVGSHGRGGFAGALLGSVSSAVSQSARMPVVVVRPA